MDNTWNLSSELAHLRSWLTPNRTDFRRDDPRRELEKLLAQYEPTTLNHVANSAEEIALWHNNLGTYQVLEGDPGGWGNLRLGLEFDTWRLRVLWHQWNKEAGRNNSSPEYGVTRATACALASAIALRDDPLADWCGNLLIREFEHPSFLIQWKRSPLFPFLTWLYALWRGRTIDARQAPIRSLGVYREVVAGWDDDTKLTSALHEACEYHCARTDSEDDPEFWWSPYPVFPGEVLAILRVREEKLGRWVQVDHPLMATPLGTVPDTIPRILDPLLERFKERVLAEEGCSTDGVTESK